jgi:hypothetical protein
MSKNMNLIMESWRVYETKITQQLIIETTVQQALQKLEKAEAAYDAAQSEEKRKQLILNAFVGVSKFAVVTTLIPVLAKAAAAMGLTGAIFGIPSLIKAFAGSSTTGEFMARFFDSIPPDIKKRFPDALEMVTGKINDLTNQMVGKLLNMPDTESAKIDILDAIDMPDKLKNFIQPNALDAIIKRIKEKLVQLSQQPGITELPADTLQLASRLIGKIGGVADMRDIRTPKNKKLSLSEEK